MQRFISEIRKYNDGIDAVQIADALWLSNVMGQGQTVDSPKPLEFKLKEPSEAKEKNKNTLPKERSHTIVISAKKELKSETNMGFENNEESIGSYGVEFPRKKELPKIEKQFMALKSKQKSILDINIDEDKTADFMASAGFFQPIFKEEKSWKRYYELHIVIDKSKSKFLWKEQIEHFVKSIRFSTLFRAVRVFEVDSSSSEAKFYQYDSKKRLHSNAFVFRKEKTLTLVFSDVLGLAWKSNHMFEVLEGWSKKSFVSIVSMLPQHMWQRTSLRTGVKLFMNAKSTFPKNNDLEAEFEFLERKLGKYSTRIPSIHLKNSQPYSWQKMMHG